VRGDLILTWFQQSPIAKCPQKTIKGTDSRSRPLASLHASMQAQASNAEWVQQSKRCYGCEGRCLGLLCSTSVLQCTAQGFVAGWHAHMHAPNQDAGDGPEQANAAPHNWKLQSMRGGQSEEIGGDVVNVEAGLAATPVGAAAPAAHTPPMSIKLSRGRDAGVLHTRAGSCCLGGARTRTVRGGGIHEGLRFSSCALFSPVSEGREASSGLNTLDRGHRSRRSR